jgi:hypothetical protein
MLGYVELADVVGNYDRAAKHAHGLDALRCAASRRSLDLKDCLSEQSPESRRSPQRRQRHG